MPPRSARKTTTTRGKKTETEINPNVDPRVILPAEADTLREKGFHYINKVMRPSSQLSSITRSAATVFHQGHGLWPRFGKTELMGNDRASLSSVPVRILKANEELFAAGTRPLKVKRGTPTVPAAKLPKEYGERLPVFVTDDRSLAEIYPSMGYIYRPTFLTSTDYEVVEAGESYPGMDESTDLVRFKPSAFEYVGDDKPDLGLMYLPDFNNSKGATLRTLNVDVFLTADGQDEGHYCLVIDVKQLPHSTGATSSTMKVPNVYRAVASDIIDKMHEMGFSKWKISTVLIVNALVDWSYMTAYRDEDDNFVHVGTQTLGSRRLSFIVTNANYKDLGDMTAKYPKVDENTFIKAWMDSILAAMLKEVATLEKSYIDLSRKVIATSQALGDKKSMINLMRNSATETYGKMLASLRSIPLVKNVNFHEKYMLVTTDDIWYTPTHGDFADKSPRYVGRYSIYIGIREGYATAVNENTPSGIAHCHAGRGTDICMSSYNGMIASAFMEMDYELAISAIVRMLSDVTESDYGARECLKLLPTKKPTENKASKQLPIYGNKSAETSMGIGATTTILVSEPIADLAAPAFDEDDDEDDDD